MEKPRDEFAIQPEFLDSVDLGPVREKKKTVSIAVNGKDLLVEEGTNVLEACKLAGAYIPTLCYHPRLRPVGVCGMCSVMVEGQDEPVISCSAKVQEGKRYVTKSPLLRSTSSNALHRMLSKQRARAMHTNVEGFLEFAELIDFAEENLKSDSNGAIVRDPENCVECSRCVRTCTDIQAIDVYEMSIVDGDPFPLQTRNGNPPLVDTDCIGCGQCASACPTGAISEVDHVPLVEKAIQEGKIMVAQIAPAARVGISEELKMPPGSVGTYKLVGALRQAGFQYVFDTQFGADLTIMEEGTEFLTRLKNGGPFPMFTSCCPGWINMMEKLYPEFIENVSTCKSPQQMMGSTLKTYWAQKMGLKPEDIFIVSCMPCTAKKHEMARDTMGRDGYRDTDAILTSRELGKWFRSMKYRFNKITDSTFDNPLGYSTGAADIFAVSGGVMEAALRTAYEIATGNELPTMNLTALRGVSGVKEATLDVGGTALNVCVLNGGASIRKVLDMIKRGEKDYHFIEIMACPGGCIGGGGQPRSTDIDILQKRMEGHYRLDRAKKLRKSHQNPDIQSVYEDFYLKPNSEKAHELLHTHYKSRKRTATIKKEESLAEPGLPGEDSLLILYGTQTGTAKQAAMGLMQAASALKLDVMIESMDRYRIAHLPRENMVVVVTSTFGDGEPPENAKKFESWIKDQSDSTMLNGIRYAVFGLGSTKYTKYCKFAKDLDEKFADLGANRIIPVGFGDEEHAEKYEGGMNDWLENLWDELGLKVPTALVAPNYRCLLCLENPKPTPAPPGAVFGKLVKNEILTPDGYDRPVLHIGIDVANTGLTYRVGDSLAIWPKNSEEHVDEFLKDLKLAPDTAISVEAVGNALQMQLPVTLTVRDLFVQYLDIFDSPRRSTFQKLALHATDEKEAAKLALLGSKEGKAEMEEYLKDGPSIADVLLDFKTVRPTLDYLLEVVPLITPRPYSIATSDKVSPDVIELVVIIPTVVSRKRGQIVGGGLCTRYLHKLPLGSKLPVRVDPGTLTPQEDTKRPIILAGLGAGIAPMRGILQDRKFEKEQGKELGPAILYYAVRHKMKDYLFQGEWDKFIKEGVLTKVIASFSHDDPKKFETIPMKMEEDPSPVWEGLKDDGAYYYCGPAAFKIPQTIEVAMSKAIARVSELNEEEAVKFIESKKQSGTFCCEAF